MLAIRLPDLGVALLGIVLVLVVDRVDERLDTLLLGADPCHVLHADVRERLGQKTHHQHRQDDRHAVVARQPVEPVQQHLKEVSGKVAGLKQLLAQLQGEYEETINKIESLNARALEVGEQVGKVEGQLAASKQRGKVMNLINNPEGADYAQHGSVVLMIAVAFLKWMSINEGKFKSTYDIKPGLQSLIKQLGGVW